MNDSSAASQPDESSGATSILDRFGVGISAWVKGVSSKWFKVIGIISGALSLIFLPIIFGPISIGCGYLLYDRGETASGKWIAIGGAVAMLTGFALALVIAAAA